MERITTAIERALQTNHRKENGYMCQIIKGEIKIDKKHEDLASFVIFQNNNKK